MRTRAPLFALVAVLGAVAGGFYAWSQQTGAVSEPSRPTDHLSLLGQERPSYTLGDVQGQRVSAASFDGDVVLLNFWATWCGPCRKEMPMLQELSSAYRDRGLKIVGIALDDVGQARDFAAQLGIDYTILVGDADVMAVGMAYGNRAGMLPYTVLIGRDRIVRWAHLGELDRAELESELHKLL